MKYLKSILGSGLLMSLILLVSFKESEKKTWIAIGDSITYLNDHTDETGNRVTKGYLSRTIEIHPEYQYQNHGYNGWTAQRVASKINDLGIGKADLYTIFLGTNDWWAGVPKGTLKDFHQNTGNGTIAGSFRIIIDHIRSQNSSAKLIVITPMQRTDFVYINNYKNNAFGSYKAKKDQNLEEIVDLIVAIAKQENLSFLDLFHEPQLSFETLVNFKYLRNPETGQYQEYKYPDYVEIPFDPENDQYPYPLDAMGTTYDGLHPSDKGNQIIAELLAKKIEEL
ncbi:SGNH/GDSL hydrolase family protein [Jiulongibacter sp. NS-SX5]|uniref:SGNH/GDSL hydrolase family protein n=1 Tax=Jiulongibacter sp. NS-SX5 TaxID=3463854 RepID=UPI00405A370F